MTTTTVVVMGVSGTGKTTVAEHLVARLGWPSAEGDTFHPPANVAKMHAGTPLDDDDRWPWLQAPTGCRNVPTGEPTRELAKGLAT